VRILFHANSPFTHGGYGVQTNLAVSRLQADHDFAISCNFGQEGFVSSWQTPHGDVPLLPKSLSSNYGTDIIGVHADSWGAEVVMTHYDAWVFDPASIGLPWVPWYPVDCEDLPEVISSRIEHAAMRFTQTHHGVAATERSGLDAEYVPAAFDGSVYYPRDPKIWREAHGIDDRFVVACVASNSGHLAGPSRKAYPQIMEGFKLFLEHQPNALLYIHASMKGQIDLARLAKRLGILDHVAGARDYYLHTGAYSASDMAEIYSGADVLLSPSMGEGFGVPIVEAQACGTPVITGDWTAMSEITRSGVAIPKTDAYKYPIMDYGDMYLVHPEAVRDALVDCFPSKDDPAEISGRVQEYEIEHVISEHWRPAMAKLERVVRPQPNREQRRRKVRLHDEAVA
jgi:glycosyltransferase involved in cell wall biosynthesis